MLLSGSPLHPGVITNYSGFPLLLSRKHQCPVPRDLLWREAGLLFSELQRHYSHQVWCEWHPQDTILREGVSWGSLGSFTGQLTLPEQLLNGGPSVWALGDGAPMAQLTQGHHRVHFTCFWGPVSVCRDHESLSGTFRGSALPGYYRTPSDLPASTCRIR